MNLRSRVRYAQAAWDWSLLDGIFPGRIRPTDIDGLVERHGRFLILEAKPWNRPVGDGQRITFDALHATGLFTIVVFWGTEPTVTHLRVWPEEKRVATIDDLRRVVSEWAKFAEGARCR